MTRLPRFTIPGVPQHVIQRGNNKATIFVSTHDYLFFRECMLSAIRRFACQIHAYVFMTNHVHFLMSPNRSGAIGRVMQSVGGRYAKYVNDRYGRTGTLWEGRYRATVINSDEYLFSCYRYIEENPVRAAIVTEPGEYRWSSYSANALGASDSLVTAHERYVALGDTPGSRQEAYGSFFRVLMQPSTISALRDSTNYGWALGDTEFQSELTRTDRRAAPVRRPRSAKCLTPYKVSD